MDKLLKQLSKETAKKLVTEAPQFKGRKPNSARVVKMADQLVVVAFLTIMRKQIHIHPCFDTV